MRLSRDFFLQPTLTVAEQLLGKHLVFTSVVGTLIGEINETEAYTEDDPASHSFKGLTQRNASMYRLGGVSYIYQIYGVYFCFNVVTQTEGVGEAVLIRGVTPIAGIDQMMQNRHVKNVFQKTDNLTNGPGKLCQAFGLTKVWDGIDMVESTSLYIEDTGKKYSQVELTPRIGITQATDRLWRFKV